MAVTILGKISAGSILICTVDKDPSTDGGVSAPIGSYACATNNAGSYYKFGSGNTDWQLNPRKYFQNTNFEAAVAKTITHNLNTTAINIALWDSGTGQAISATTLGARTANTVDITLAATLASVDIIITG